MNLRGIQTANEPFIIQVYARAGECLRLDVDSQTEDTALLLVAPAVNYGGISDDRDFDGGDTRPLFALDPVPWTGWYTVAISYFDFDNRSARFNLIYGRYFTGNPNCQPPPAVERQQLAPMADSLLKVKQPAKAIASESPQDE
jgi:hypothetical protein